MRSWATIEPEDEPGVSPRGTVSIQATPYQCRNPSTIPLRPWIYGRQLLRGSLSVLIAPGAVGKTSLTIGMGLALATGRSLLDKSVWEGPKRAWLWNLEDSGEELSRTIEAARLHWKIEEGDIGGRLFVDSALDGAALCTAVEDNGGFRILEPVIENIIAELQARKIDVLIVDPFVSSHMASENNNGAIDAIAKKWAMVAERANCSVCLVHHTKKLGGREASVEESRGAVSLTNAARSVVALNQMSADEAGQWGIEGNERKRYFRAYDDKPNRAPSAATSDWYMLTSVDLGNGSQEAPGDNIQVVSPWTPPDAFTGLTWQDLREVQSRVTREECRANVQSPMWVGYAVADVLGLDASDKKGPDATRIKSLLRTWIKNGALLEVREKDAKGTERPCIRAGKLAEPDGPTP